MQYRNSTSTSTVSILLILYRNSASTPLLPEFSSFLQEFAERAAAFFNALEKASLVDESDPFADLLEPYVFKKQRNEIVVVRRLASNS